MILISMVSGPPALLIKKLSPWQPHCNLPLSMSGSICAPNQSWGKAASLNQIQPCILCTLSCVTSGSHNAWSVTLLGPRQKIERRPAPASDFVASTLCSTPTLIVRMLLKPLSTWRIPQSLRLMLPALMHYPTSYLTCHMSICAASAEQTQKAFACWRASLTKTFDLRRTWQAPKAGSIAYEVCCQDLAQKHEFFGTGFCQNSPHQGQSRKIRFSKFLGVRTEDKI